MDKRLKPVRLDDSGRSSFSYRIYVKCMQGIVNSCNVIQESPSKSCHAPAVKPNSNEVTCTFQTQH